MTKTQISEINKMRNYITVPVLKWQNNIMHEAHMLSTFALFTHLNFKKVIMFV